MGGGGRKTAAEQQRLHGETQYKHSEKGRLLQNRHSQTNAGSTVLNGSFEHERSAHTTYAS